MSGPVIVRPWQFRANRMIVGTQNGVVFPPQYLIATLSQNSLFDVKSSLLGVGTDWTNLSGTSVTPTGNWSVSFSCNSVSAGAPGDGSDKWLTAANLVSGTGAAVRSWIVLRQPGVAPNFEMCVELNSTNPYQGSVVISPNSRFGFNGGGAGATNARPTAVDEIVLSSAADFGFPATAENSSRITVMKSADGAATRVLILRGGFVAGFWSLEAPSKALSGWQHPSFGFVSASSASRISTPVPSLTALNNTAVAKSRSLDFPNGVAFNSFLTVSSGGAAVGLDPVAQLAPNDIDGTTPFYMVELFSTATYGARGRAGVMTDAWFVPQNYTDGTNIPKDDSRQFLVAGILTMPWNRSVPIWL